VKVRVAACTRIFRNARTGGTRRRGAGIFGGTGDFPGITLDLFNWVHGQRCAGGFAKLMAGGSGAPSTLLWERFGNPLTTVVVAADILGSDAETVAPTFVSVAGGHGGRRFAYSWG